VNAPLVGIPQVATTTPVRSAIFFAISVTVVLMAAVIDHLVMVSNRSVPSLASPKEDLRVFFEVNRFKSELLGDIEDLETEDFTRYAQPICLTADSSEQAQESLRLSLADVGLCSNVRPKQVTTTHNAL
jgi:hypothetical protein